MTLQLDLSPDAAAVLERAATAQNMALDAFIREVAEREAARLAANEDTARAQRRAAIRRLRGSMAGVPGTVDDFLRERHAEALEDERKAAA